MKQESLAIIKQKLLDEKQKLEEQLSKFTEKSAHIKGDYNATFPEYGDKEDENAAEVAEFSDNLSLERTLEKSLADVDGALDRIKKGTYGTCRHCGKEIDEKRLVARPVSSACIDCKEKLSRQ